MQEICDNCGKKYGTHPMSVQRAKYHFCSVKCYHDYRKKHRYGYVKKGSKRDLSTLNKIKRFAEAKEQLVNGTYRSN